MSQRRFEAIVIGASAGAIEALSVLIPKLQGMVLLPLIIVVHIPSDKNSMIAEIFRTKYKGTVKEAEDKETIKTNTIYFAPPDYHLLVEPSKMLSLSSEAPLLFSRPSIDILFETAADAYGDKLIGIILTGANNDGAAGLKAVAQAGGIALVQDAKTAYAKAMPEAALAACPTAQKLTLEQIAEYIMKAGTL